MNTTWKPWMEDLTIFSGLSGGGASATAKAADAGLQDLALELSLWGLILVVMIGAGYVLVRRFRSYAVEDKGTPLDMLTNFREMSSKGDITDAEFRTIKSLLGSARGEPAAPKSETKEKSS